MTRTVGYHVVTAIVVLLFYSSVAEAGDPVQGERLFRITRNKNNNIVCYDVHQKEGRLDKDNPVSVYWIIPSKQNRLENLNFVERTKAYGVSIGKTFGQDSVEIMLKSAEKSIRVTQRGSRWVALMAMDSREVAIDSVFVMADESGARPTVQWVEVIGHDASTGESVRKKINK